MTENPNEEIPISDALTDSGSKITTTFSKLKAAAVRYAARLQNKSAETWLWITAIAVNTAALLGDFFAGPVITGWSVVTGATLVVLFYLGPPRTT